VLSKASNDAAASEQHQDADCVEAQPSNQPGCPISHASEYDNRDSAEQEKEVEVPPNCGLSVAHKGDLISNNGHGKLGN